MDEGAENTRKLKIKDEAILWHEEAEKQHDVGLDGCHLCGQGQQEQQAVDHGQ
jgi:hypothetical protein